MHVIFRETHGLDESELPTDLRQTPADIVVLSFSDGHVESHRWTDQRTIAAYSPDYHAHNDPAPRNNDLAWLRERTTVLK